MTRKSRREVERALDDLGGDVPDPDPRFLEVHGDGRSDEWLREEWAACVREARQRGCDPAAAAWIRALKRAEEHNSDAPAHE